MGDGNKNFPRMTTKNKELVNDLAFLVMLLQRKDLRLKKDSGVYRLEVRDGLPFLDRIREQKKTYPYTIPKEFVLNLFERLGKIGNLRQAKRKSVPKEKIMEAIKELKRKKLFKKTIIEKLLNSDIGFDRVKDVIKIKSTKKWVYDLSVKKQERFLAGFGICNASVRHGTGDISRYQFARFFLF